MPTAPRMNVRLMVSRLLVELTMAYPCGDHVEIECKRGGFDHLGGRSQRQRGSCDDEGVCQ